MHICLLVSNWENILFIAKPYWAEGGEPQNIETSIGASATFYCNASGDPQPELEWYINGVRLKGIQNFLVPYLRI